MPDDKYLASLASLVRTFVPVHELEKAPAKREYLINFFETGSPASKIVSDAASEENFDRFIGFVLMDEKELLGYLEG